jgi:hypothetical protein
MVGRGRRAEHGACLDMIVQIAFPEFSRARTQLGLKRLVIMTSTQKGRFRQLQLSFSLISLFFFKLVIFGQYFHNET